jgi:hypothetical protein
MDVPWAMIRKLALVLFVLALLAGLASTALFMGHRLPLETWRVVFVLALIVLTITSTVLIPDVLLPTIRNPHPEFLTDDMVDEWAELRQRRISRPHLLLAGGAIAALAYFWLLFYYGKVTNAFWFGWFPVGVAAIGLSLLLVAVARQTDWYVNRYFRTPTWVILVAFAGFIASQYLGIYMTEQIVAPPGGQALALRGDPSDYIYAGTRAYYIIQDFAPAGGVPDVDAPDCDDEGCAYLILAILVVVLVLILVAGAALIPHMWVLSGLVLLTLIALLVLHDIRRDRSLEQWYDRAPQHPQPAS